MAATTIIWDADRAAAVIVTDGSMWGQPVDACNVLRLDPVSNTYVPVRGGTGLTQGGWVSLTDLEAPVDSTVTYKIEALSSTGVLTEIVGPIPTPLVTGALYLKDVVHGLSARCFLREVTSVDRPTIGGMYRPPYGQARSHRAGVDGYRVDITVGVDTADAARQVGAVLAAGAVLLQQDGETGFPDGYYFFESQPRQTRVPGIDSAWWDWSLQLQDDAAPAGDFAMNAGAFTYDMLTETGLTYDELKARGSTYFDWTLGRY